MQDIAEQRIYCAEQIYVPDELPLLMKRFSKAVIRAQPKNLIDFALEYFEAEVAKDKLGEQKSEKEVWEKPQENLIKRKDE